MQKNVQNKNETLANRWIMFTRLNLGEKLTINQLAENY